MSNTPEGYVVAGARPDGRGSGTWRQGTWDARAMTAVAPVSPGPADSDAVPRMPDDPDLQLARDPRAGAGRLMVLAGNRPDLRGVIADNPGCSPELRAWVSRMGGASAGPGGGGHGGRGGPEAAVARTGGSGGVDDADDAVSLAPTGWEPSDIGLGEDPFGSVLGDPLMGSPLFDDGGRDGDADDGAAGDAEGGRPTGRARGGQLSQGRRTARAHTAVRRRQRPGPRARRRRGHRARRCDRSRRQGRAAFVVEPAYGQAAHRLRPHHLAHSRGPGLADPRPAPAAAGSDEACAPDPDAARTLRTRGALPGAGDRRARWDRRAGRGRPGSRRGRPLGRRRSARRRPADRTSAALRPRRRPRRLLRDGALQRPGLLAQRQEVGPVVAVQHEPGQDHWLDPLRPAVHRHPGPQWLRREGREGAGARPRRAGAPQGAAEPGVEPLGALVAGMVMGLFEA